jgi:hypothetical protein
VEDEEFLGTLAKILQREMSDLEKKLAKKGTQSPIHPFSLYVSLIHISGLTV